MLECLSYDRESGTLERADMTSHATGYIRVSTAGQVEDGVSIEAQAKRIEAWCLANDVELSAVFTDEGISGKRADNRPQLQLSLIHI